MPVQLRAVAVSSVGAAGGPVGVGVGMPVPVVWGADCGAVRGRTGELAGVRSTPVVVANVVLRVMVPATVPD